MTYCLAIDIGASSGRHILGHIENGRIVFEEIYRFDNGFEIRNGSLCWNLDRLFAEVKAGIKKCAELEKIPETIAIDTWGVDYVLLDKDKNELAPAFCYRDSRTDAVVSKVEAIIPQNILYERTGIQKMSFNTVYQLYADKLSGKLDKAEYYLMIPDYLSYRLTGVIKNEYTNASTTGMVNAVSKEWDNVIIGELGLPKRLFKELNPPASVIGSFTDEMREYAGFDSTVIFAPSHDTASAVAATPLNDGDLYVSSGTWSLIGMESKAPFINEETQKANFTNEGGIEYRFRFLKNYIGMWFLQNIRKDLNRSLSYDEMMSMSRDCSDYKYFDVNDKLFSAPDNMIEAIRTYFGDPDMRLESVLSSVYHSLARSYKNAVSEIEGLTGRTVGDIHIVGGGSKDSYLNELTAKYTGKRVVAGPVEATAAGNLISQLIYLKQCKNLTEARALIKNSFDMEEIEI